MRNYKQMSSPGTSGLKSFVVFFLVVDTLLILAILAVMIWITVVATTSSEGASQFSEITNSVASQISSVGSAVASLVSANKKVPIEMDGEILPDIQPLDGDAAAGDAVVQGMVHGIDTGDLIAAQDISEDERGFIPEDARGAHIGDRFQRNNSADIAGASDLSIMDITGIGLDDMVIA